MKSLLFLRSFFTRKFLGAILALLLSSPLLSADNASAVRVAVVGNSFRSLTPILTQAGFTTQPLEAIPDDAAQLVSTADVVIVTDGGRDRPTEAQEKVLENFVRGGGGLWVDGAPPLAGGWLQSMTSGIALDGRKEALVTLDAADGSPLADLDFKSLPRLDQGSSVAPPGSGQLDMMNMLSPWYFSKPLWLDGWQTWVTGPAPHRLSFLTVTRYGAGHTAIWSAGKGLSDPALTAWAGYPELCRRVITWLGSGAPATGAAPLHPVFVDGLTGPSYWSDGLDKGLKGMGQKQTLADFITPPVALLESGYDPVPDASAPAAAFFGAKSDTPSQAAVVLRAPFIEKATEPAVFDPKIDPKTDTGTAVSQVSFVGDDGKESPVSLPHRIPAPQAGFPTLGSTGGPPAIDLPAQWKIDYTQDPDQAYIDYARKDFDDSAWKTAAVGKQSTTLFGRTVGYDGAIWYRGHINLPAGVVAPDVSLVFQGGGQNLQVFVDGQSVAIEPKAVSVPLTTIGAGDHLIAVRTYGELRTNYGLLSVTAVRLPLLWRPDPHQEGWAGNWASPDADLKDWRSVSEQFGAEPAGREAQEGWLRLSVDVPDNAAPFAVLFQVSINVKSRLFINGVAQESHGFERGALYKVPAASFHPGHNVVVFWMNFKDAQGKTLTSEVVAAQPRIYRTVVHADQAGGTLQAEIQYDNPISMPYSASIRVGGHVVGGYIGKSGPDPILLAPHALAQGDNQVEIAVTGGIVGTFGLKSLRVRDVPENVRLPIAGWERMRASDAPADWYQPTVADQTWEPAGYVVIQDWEKIWVVKQVPDLGNPDYVYRTHLVLTDQDLKKNLTLFLKADSIHQLFVNGRPVPPDEEYFYSLNHALKVGDNVLAFQPSYATYRGANILLPTGRVRGVYTPELRTDVAALEPVPPELAGYRLNRVFPASTWVAPADGTVLFRRPNGDPAIVMRAVGAQKEISAAPGIFDHAFPGPNLAIMAKQSGAVSTPAFEYGTRLDRDALQKEAYEQLIPSLLAYGEGRSAWITNVQPAANTARLTVHGQPGGKAQLAWRLLDWEGLYLSTGTVDLTFGTDGNAQAVVPLPDLTDGTHDQGTGMGCFVRLRAAILSADRREIIGHLDHLVYPTPTVSGYVRLDPKPEALNATTGQYERRILHESLDELVERSVYLPGETPHATAYLENSTASPQSVSINLTATGGLNGKTVQQKTDVQLAPFQRKNVVLTVDAAATASGQPWKILLEVAQDGQVISRDRRSFTVAQPQGEITDIMDATKQGRSAGGYMWQMTPHALQVEHRVGTDALPVPGPWWAAVRSGGDGNWLVAEAMEYDNQSGLLWGPFFDQGRGEEINSFGWYPNGQSFRQWWAPYAMRELQRTNGTQSVVFNLSDWWQYDAGYPDNNYATFEMFNNWLVAHKGQTIAGMKIDGQPIVVSTLTAMEKLIQTQYKGVFAYFVSEGLAHSAAFTGQQLEATSPGSVQMGQGAYASRLPGTEGGVTLAPQWAQYESLGILDADNHYFAGIYQYALETATFRALGVHNGLRNGWERPQAYHAVKDTPASMVPMDASFWQNRLLDSRWQVIGDDKGEFARVLNLTHDETMGGASGLMAGGSVAIGAGMLPAHWQINDKLSNLAMTIGAAKPLSPLLVVGESDADWGTYYGTLGKFRDAGLNLGGAVSVAELAKLKPEDIPGLVWMPSAQVSGPLLAAVQEKVEAGVPLLIIGKVPASEQADWSKWLGVAAQDSDTAPDGPETQEVDPAWQKFPAARGIAQTFKAPMPYSSYTAQPGGMQPIIQRSGRLVVGVSDQPQKKVVFYGLNYPLFVQDDAAVRQLAVDAFQGMQKRAVAFDDQTGGYAFAGLDGATYVVVENRQSYAAQAHVQVNLPVTSAANLLTGENLTASPKGDGAEITVPLQADGATVIVVRK